MSAATPTRPQIGALRLLSIEDEADKIAGSLDSLRLEGHEIVSEAEASAARARLEDEDFDVLILDQRLADDDQGGAGIIRALKNGEFGQRNVDVYFLFVTASREWVDHEAMSRLRGFLGVEVKGSDLTRRIMRCLARAQLGPRVGEDFDERRRVPVRVEAASEEALSVVAPPWDPVRQLRLPLSELPRSIRGRPETLIGRWLFARMNLYEPDPERLVFSDFEFADPLDDDDGLA